MKISFGSVIAASQCPKDRQVIKKMREATSNFGNSTIAPYPENWPKDDASITITNEDARKEFAAFMALKKANIVVVKFEPNIEPIDTNAEPDARVQAGLAAYEVYKPAERND